MDDEEKKENKERDSMHSDDKLVVAAALASLVLIGLVVLVVYCVRRGRRAERERRDGESLDHKDERENLFGIQTLGREYDIASISSTMVVSSNNQVRKMSNVSITKFSNTSSIDLNPNNDKWPSTEQPERRTTFEAVKLQRHSFDKGQPMVAVKVKKLSLPESMTTTTTSNTPINPMTPIEKISEKEEESGSKLLMDNTIFPMKKAPLATMDSLPSLCSSDSHPKGPQYEPQSTRPLSAMLTSSEWTEGSAMLAARPSVPPKKAPQLPAKQRINKSQHDLESIEKDIKRQSAKLIVDTDYDDVADGLNGVDIDYDQPVARLCQQDSYYDFKDHTH